MVRISGIGSRVGSVIGICALVLIAGITFAAGSKAVRTARPQ